MTSDPNTAMGSSWYHEENGIPGYEHKVEGPVNWLGMRLFYKKVTYEEYKRLINKTNIN